MPEGLEIPREAGGLEISFWSADSRRRKRSAGGDVWRKGLLALLSPRVTLCAGIRRSCHTECHTEVFQAMARKLGTRGNSPGAPHWGGKGRSGLGLMNLRGVWASLESLRDSWSCPSL